MKYVGSKNRISKYITPIIQSYIDNGCTGYFEPFVGGANLIDKIKCDKKFGSDSNKYLIALLEKVRDNPNDLPPHLSEDEYKRVRDNKDDYDNWYVGLVGFCGSFGAKFFNGYARGFKNDGTTPRDHFNEGVRNLLKQSKNLQGIKFNCMDFKDCNPIKNFVIYCDPPYKNTISKSAYKQGNFPYDEFYDWCRKMAKDNIVIVSEYDMPDDFECIWEKELSCTLRKDGNYNKNVEKLFMVKGGKR